METRTLDITPYWTDLWRYFIATDKIGESVYKLFLPVMEHQDKLNAADDHDMLEAAVKRHREKAEITCEDTCWCWKVEAIVSEMESEDDPQT